MMNKTNDDLYMTTPLEPVCGLEAERVEYKIISDYGKNYRDNIRQNSPTTKKKDEPRIPAKRNGCIGNWLERMAGDCDPKFG